MRVPTPNPNPNANLGLDEGEALHEHVAESRPAFAGRLGELTDVDRAHAVRVDKVIGHVGVQPVGLDELDVEVALEVFGADEGRRLGEAWAELLPRPRALEHAVDGVLGHLAP